MGKSASGLLKLFINCKKEDVPSLTPISGLKLKQLTIRDPEGPKHANIKPSMIAMIFS